MEEMDPEVKKQFGRMREMAFETMTDFEQKAFDAEFSIRAKWAAARERYDREVGILRFTNGKERTGVMSFDLPYAQALEDAEKAQEAGSAAN